MPESTIISTSEADRIRSDLASFDAWRAGRSSRHPSEIPPDVPRVSNDEVSALEVFEFKQSPPSEHFVYYTGDASRGQLVTTWTGDVLGRITDAGRIWTSNFGDKRRAVTVHAINGCTYHGTAQLSAGTYVRLRMAAASVEREVRLARIAERYPEAAAEARRAGEPTL